MGRKEGDGESGGRVVQEGGREGNGGWKERRVGKEVGGKFGEGRKGGIIKEEGGRMETGSGNVE